MLNFHKKLIVYSSITEEYGVVIKIYFFNAGLIIRGESYGAKI